ncbi:hypothetical protein SteCoe_20877 [Stentor coeruleus]|uniref:Ion transport domain-containing protein n=1 Tax=Stentor coeruleus TaxID=5963 RepID=A0A1R2BR19_9CILI|nr:hypothetical protein SteCoe_20877 [Stentor coeruleus]
MEKSPRDFNYLNQYHRKVAFYGSPKAQFEFKSADNDQPILLNPQNLILGKKSALIDEILKAMVLRILGENFEKQINKDLYQKHKHFVIPRFNPWKRTFDLIINMLLMYSIISSMYYLGYDQPGYKQFAFDLFVWVMFIIDIVLTFFTEIFYKGKESVKDLNKIAHHYISTWLFFDVISLLPLQFAGHPNAEYFLRLFRLTKIYRLLDMIDQGKINSCVAGIFGIKNSKRAHIFKIVITYSWSLSYQIIAMLFASYALSCMWMYYVKVVEKYQGETDNFRDHFGLNVNTSDEIFIKSWYYIYTTLMTVGYGDFYATNKYEMGFCIILLIIGPSMYAYAMGKSIDTIKKLEEVGKNDEKLSEFDTWISSLEFHYKELPIDLKEGLINHFKYYFENNRAGPLAEKYWNYPTKAELGQFHSKFVSELPEKLRIRVLNAIFIDVFYKFKPFFGRVDSFRYYVCLHIQPRSYSEKTTIIYENIIPLEIFFIEKGEVVCGVESDTGFVICYSFKERGIIGDYFVVQSIPSFATYFTSMKTQGFAIPSKVVIKVLKHFPKHAENLKALSSKSASLIEYTIKKELSNTCSKFQDTEPEPEKAMLNTSKKTFLKNLGVSPQKKIACAKKIIALNKKKGNGEFKDLDKVIANAERSKQNILSETVDKFSDIAQFIKNQPREKE